MDTARLKEWFSTEQARLNLLTLVVTAFITLSTTIGGWLNSFFDMLGVAARVGTYIANAVVFITGSSLLWLSYRRFNQASRLERPDAFTLHPTTPKTLIGRDEDTSQLTASVKRFRLILLDGESGCGKSALIGAGLVPTLREENALLPVVLREWGEDWETGPLTELLDGLHRALSSGVDGSPDWNRAPDLAATPLELLAQVSTRLNAISDHLHRRVLIIADQFDDYQARHHDKFLDSDGNWLTPAALAANSRFWELVCGGLASGALHLLVVSRSDMAAGLSCVRFLDQVRTAARTLKPINTEWLEPLLANLTNAPDGTAIVSHPDGGWLRLRARVIRDLEAEGAILMQRVRMVLHGLRRLPRLTPKHYEAAGGLRGVEMLVIAGALREAALAARGADGAQVAAAVLDALVLEGGADRPAQSQRASLTHLRSVVGDEDRTTAILDELQRQEVIRPAESAGGEPAWQLDHNYLARAVLAHARQADRWSAFLREKKARYDFVAGDWRRRYAALLPMPMVARLVWEWVRGRVRFGASAGYVAASAFKPAVLCLCLALAGGIFFSWYQDRLLTEKAFVLIGGFATDDEGASALETWRAPAPLRQHIFQRLRADPGHLPLALKAQWHFAHAGCDPRQAHGVLSLLNEQIIHSPSASTIFTVTDAYGDIVRRFGDAAQPTALEAPLRARLLRERDSNILEHLTRLYAVIAPAMTDATVQATAAASLRTRLLSEPDMRNAQNLGTAYAAVMSRLSNGMVLKSNLDALRGQLDSAPDTASTQAIAAAYKEVSTRLARPEDIAAEAAAVRKLLLPQTDVDRARMLAAAYGDLAARLSDHAEIRSGAASLRARLEQEAGSPLAYPLAHAYAAIAARSGEGAAQTDVLPFLRQVMDRQTSRHPYVEIRQGMSGEEKFEHSDNHTNIQGLLRNYQTVAARLTDPTTIRTEAAALRGQLGQSDGEIAQLLSQAYITVIERMDDPLALEKEARAWRARLIPDAAGSYARLIGIDYTVQVYRAVVTRMRVPEHVKAEAAAIRMLLDGYPDGGQAIDLTSAYQAVATALILPADVISEVRALRAHLTKPGGSNLATKVETAYLSAVARVREAPDIQAEAAALRMLMAQPSYDEAYWVAAGYAALTERLNDRNAMRDEVQAIQLLLERDWRGGTIDIVKRAFARLVIRLNDPQHTETAAAMFHNWLDNPAHNGHLVSMAEDYSALVRKRGDARLLDEAAIVLRRQIEREPEWSFPLLRPYAAVAAQLNDASRRIEAAAFIRSQILLSPQIRSPEAYVLIAARLQEPDVLKREARTLRARLEKEVHESIAQAYLAVAPRLASQADLDAEAAALAALLARIHDRFDAATVARTYAALAAVRLGRSPPSKHEEVVTELLVLAGHPFLPQPNDLLAILPPLARSENGNDLSRTLQWAEEEYGLRPARLRPGPLPGE